MIATPHSPRKTPPRSTRSGAGLCAAFCSGVVGLSLTLHLDAKHVEFGSWRVYPLPEFFYAAFAFVAPEAGEIIAGPAEPVQDSSKTWSVVHDFPVIIKYNWDAEVACAGIAGNLHRLGEVRGGSKLVDDHFGVAAGFAAKVNVFDKRGGSFFNDGVCGFDFRQHNIGLIDRHRKDPHPLMPEIEGSILFGASPAALLELVFDFEGVTRKHNAHGPVFGFACVEGDFCHFFVRLVRASLPLTQSTYTVPVYTQHFFCVGRESPDFIARTRG